MAKTIELTVPDIGGFEDVPIIEILIAAGDSIGKDAPLVTLESDKATMEVPASAAGTVRDVRVKIGDRVSQGSVLANVEVADDAPATIPAAPSTPVSAAAGAEIPVAGGGNEAAELTTSDSAGTPAAATSADSTMELVVPDIGDFENIPVITVFVNAGDTIAKDAALVELESDKATMEVPALAGGVIRDVRVHVGDRVSQGSVIATVAMSGVAAPKPAAAVGSPAALASTTASTPASPGQPMPPAAAAQAAGAQAPDSNTALPQQQPEPTISAPVLAAAIAPPSQPSKNGSSNGAVNGASHGTADAPVHAGPAIRRFARELGITLSSVKGSGPNGRITREDIQNYVKRSLADAAAAPAPPATAPAASQGGLQLLPWPKIDFAKFGPIERKPLSRIAKISGQNLARNWVLIPHVTQHEDADVTDLEAFRKTTNFEQKDVKVTMLAFLIKAVIATLRQYPTFNSSLDGEDLVLKQYYHIGFAADTPNGLVVPVVRDADKKGVLALAAETAALAKKARDGKLGPADMSGSTFTISSLGGIGGTSFTPIINAPEVAILGVCRTATRPVWDGAAFAPRLILPLSLSYDHRVIDGAAAARFCAHLAGILADMRKTML